MTGLSLRGEMALFDSVRQGSTSALPSCSSAMAPARLACTTSRVAVAFPLLTTPHASVQKASRGYSAVLQAARAASGSVQQQGQEQEQEQEQELERIAAVGNITVGRFLVQGLRDEMEDEIVVVDDGPNGFSYAAIFDGHAGVFSASFLRDELYKDCLTALEGGAILESNDLKEAEEALSRAFLETDKRLISRLESSKAVAEAESGSTATVVFARSDRLVLAYVGDSRAVLSRNGKAQGLTSDHRPFGRDKKSFLEVKRIQEAGGWVSYGRVCGMLSVSRAFGDISFKTRKQQMLDLGIAERRWTKSFANGRNLNGEWLVAAPDTSSMLLNEEAEFLILASDGLWDSLKSAEAVDFVRERLKQHGDVQRASEEVAQEALNRGGQDNVSVIIVDFGRTPAESDDQEPGWKFW